MASEKVDRFVEMLAPAAVEIGARYGLDPALIISQSALETGWGDSVAGNNYFGVKSHGKEGGNTVLTHEEVNGKMVPIYDSFRAYDGVRDSMEDYARFLSENPRYRDVFNQSGVGNQIDAVAAAGYATDSQYANKLKAIANMFDLSRYGAEPQTRDVNFPQGRPNSVPRFSMSYANEGQRLNGLPQIGPTGGPALGAIMRATGKSPSPSWWSNPGATLKTAFGGITAPVMRAASSPQSQERAIGALMGTLPGRTVIMRAAMNQNIGAVPSIMKGHSSPGTQAMAVSNAGASPVTLSSSGGSGAAASGAHGNWNPDVYRANAAVLGSNGFTQTNIDRALSSGQTLMKRA